MKHVLTNLTAKGVVAFEPARIVEEVVPLVIKDLGIEHLNVQVEVKMSARGKKSLSETSLDKFINDECSIEYASKVTMYLNVIINEHFTAKGQAKHFKKELIKALYRLAATYDKEYREYIDNDDVYYKQFMHIQKNKAAYAANTDYQNKIEKMYKKYLPLVLKDLDLEGEDIDINITSLDDTKAYKMTLQGQAFFYKQDTPSDYQVNIHPYAALALNNNKNELANYVFVETLAHELRHIYQAANNIEFDKSLVFSRMDYLTLNHEIDARRYAADFMDRFYEEEMTFRNKLESINKKMEEKLVDFYSK